jgi:hypothetical protein
VVLRVYLGTISRIGLGDWMAEIATIREATVERVRRHRERRRRGMRCLTIEIHVREIDAFVRHGLLEERGTILVSRSPIYISPTNLRPHD